VDTTLLFPLLTAILSAALTALYFVNQLRQRERENARLAAELRFEKEQATEKATLLREAREQLQGHFATLSQQALQANTQQFLDLAKQVLGGVQNESKADLDKRQTAIAQMLLPFHDTMQRLHRETEHLREKSTGAHVQLTEQIKGLTELQNAVRSETARLVEAIRKPSVRGRWGEMTLRRVLEHAGMLAHCDFLEQHSTRDDNAALHRPDVVLKLPGERCIVIDAKVPFDAWLSATLAEDEAARKAHMASHIRQVKTHIKQLGAKTYWDKLDVSPEFVIMFVPGESAFSAALEEDPELLAESWRHRVVLATPTTLMATVMAVAYSWKQEALARNAEQAVELGRKLYDRFCEFSKHMHGLGKALNKSVESYNSAAASLETRLIPQAQRFEDLQIASASGTKVIQTAEQVVLTARSIEAVAVVETIESAA
jgi:DNA recombination protein RmuC